MYHNGLRIFTPYERGYLDAASGYAQRPWTLFPDNAEQRGAYRIGYHDASVEAVA